MSFYLLLYCGIIFDVWFNEFLHINTPLTITQLMEIGFLPPQGFHVPFPSQYSHHYHPLPQSDHYFNLYHHLLVLEVYIIIHHVLCWFWLLFNMMSMRFVHGR
jgi:hypothetical protein